jgi:hypothetical protein
MYVRVCLCILDFKQIDHFENQPSFLITYSVRTGFRPQIKRPGLIRNRLASIVGKSPDLDFSGRRHCPSYLVDVGIGPSDRHLTHPTKYIDAVTAGNGPSVQPHPQPQRAIASKMRHPSLRSMQAAQDQGKRPAVLHAPTAWGIA